MRKRLKNKRFLLTLAAVLGLLLLLSLAMRGCKRADGGAAGGGDSAALAGADAVSAAANFTELRYSNEIATLSFARDETEKWVWQDEPEFPLDGAALDELCTVIAALHPMQTLTVDEKKQEEWGLTEPAASLFAKTIDGKETTLLFGKELSDGSYYMKTADAETVYVVSKELRGRISRGIYELALLESFPPLPREAIATVTFEGAQSFVLRGSAEGKLWRADGADVSAKPATEAVLQELSALRFSSCADYRPSAEAVKICGMAAPTLRVTVAYTTEQGSEASVTLTVGKKSPAGDSYFAKINDGSTIYTIAQASIQALLSAGAKGLSA